MFSKLFTRNHPVEVKKIKPDATFLEWLEQMRNPSTACATLPVVKTDPTDTQSSSREAA